MLPQEKFCLFFMLSFLATSWRPLEFTTVAESAGPECIHPKNILDHQDCRSTVLSTSWLWALTGYVPIQKNISLTQQSTFMEVSWRTTNELDFCLNQQVALQAMIPSGCIPALGGAGRTDRDVCDHQVPQDRLNDYEE